MNQITENTKGFCFNTRILTVCVNDWNTVPHLNDLIKRMDNAGFEWCNHNWAGFIKVNDDIHLTGSVLFFTDSKTLQFENKPDFHYFYYRFLWFNNLSDVVDCNPDMNERKLFFSSFVFGCDYDKWCRS